MTGCILQVANMPLSPHWGLNPGPSVYKTDALPLSYRGRCDFHHTICHKAIRKGEKPNAIIQLYARTRITHEKAYRHTYSLSSSPYRGCLSDTTWIVDVLPRRVRCARQCAMPVQHARAPEQARRDTSPDKNKCDKQVSSWRHISCHTDKNRYYT